MMQRRGETAYLNVFQGDHAGGASVLVHDDGHVDPALAHFLEASPYRHRFRHEVSGLHDLRDGKRQGKGVGTAGDRREDREPPSQGGRCDEGEGPKKMEDMGGEKSEEGYTNRRESCGQAGTSTKGGYIYVQAYIQASEQNEATKVREGRGERAGRQRRGKGGMR